MQMDLSQELNDLQPGIDIISSPQSNRWTDRQSCRVVETLKS